MDKYILSEVCYQNGYEQGYKDAMDKFRWKDPKVELPDDLDRYILVKTPKNYSVEKGWVLKTMFANCIGWRDIIN